MLTAEKERVFLGVRDKDRPPELDCCFLLRSVLREQRQEEKRGVKTAGMVTPPSGRELCVVTPTSPLSWWCSDSGSSQQRSHFHSDPGGAGSAATFWAIRTQRRSGAPAQTPGQLWSSWNWDEDREAVNEGRNPGKEYYALQKNPIS